MSGGLGGAKNTGKNNASPVHGGKKRISIGGVLRLDAPPEIVRGQGNS